MVRTTHTLTIASLLLLSACPSTDNNVGTVLTDGGGAGGAAHTGGTTPASTGTGGGSGDGSGTAGCVYQGVTYAKGESFKVDCNTCTCGRVGDGLVSCTQVYCPGLPASTGGTAGASTGVSGNGGGAQGGADGGTQDAANTTD